MPLTRQITGLSQAENRRNHVVKEPHVAAVFLRVSGIVFGIFLGVAARAEGLVAGSGKHNGDDIAGSACGAERENDRLYHFGIVGIKLRRIIERYPRIVEPSHRRAVFPPHRPFLITHPLGCRQPALFVDEIVIFHFVFGGGDIADGFGAHDCTLLSVSGTRTARRVSAPAWAASKT